MTDASFGGLIEAEALITTIPSMRGTDKEVEAKRFEIEKFEKSATDRIKKAWPDVGCWSGDGRAETRSHTALRLSAPF